MVLLIIGILLAIGLPTFLSTTKTANTTSAQANLQTALTGANVYFTDDHQTYSGVNVGGNPNVSDISQIDTGLTFVSGSNSTNLNIVSLWTDGSSSLVLAAYAKGTRDCWYIIDLRTAGTGVWGLSNDGTYYSVDPNIDASTCVSSGTKPGGAVAPQKGGWPSI